MNDLIKKIRNSAHENKNYEYSITEADISQILFFKNVVRQDENIKRNNSKEQEACRPQATDIKLIPA